MGAMMEMAGSAGRDRPIDSGRVRTIGNVEFLPAYRRTEGFFYFGFLIAGRDRGGYLRACVYPAMALCLILVLPVVGCGFGEEDNTEAGRNAIRLVMRYKVPLGHTIDRCIDDYLYDQERQGNPSKRLGWNAYRRPYLKEGHRVTYQFILKQKEREARWIADIKTGSVEPENQLARTIMRLP